MPHHPILFHNIGLSFPQKVCFEGFTTQIHPGNRIAIIGQNGSGKSTLLKMIQGIVDPSAGDMCLPHHVTFGYVPQIIDDFTSLSGGQRFNRMLSQALAPHPDILLLDEPTNHLDLRNRRSLMRLLQQYTGTLIIVSHDGELLRYCIQTLWHIEGGQVHIFSGNYDDYMRERDLKRASLLQEISRFVCQKKQTHHALMQEQERARKSRLQGEKHIRERKWPTIVSDAKARRAAETSGRKRRAIDHQKQALIERLTDLRVPEIIVPQFSLPSSDLPSPSHTIVSIREGMCGFTFPLHHREEGRSPDVTIHDLWITTPLPSEEARDDGLSHKIILNDINLSLGARDRLAILGDNGSGKTTLVKAIWGDPSVIKEGVWDVPPREDIGYLDQHYHTLDPQKTVLETLQDAVPTWSQGDIRDHLNTFLFRKNEEVHALVKTLSGGEKARLSLAQIAAKTPKLLILDEMTNNLDLETRDHVIQVLAHYPRALILISHDEDFLKAIGVSHSHYV